MALAIRKNFRNFVAILVLLIVALLTSYVILQHQRLRIPILEDKPFELKADFQTAQAVVPGQGQTIDVAGVPIGEVENVELVNGVAQVTFGIERKFLPVYQNATILMRPRTGLKDMFFEMDPGTPQKSAPDNGVVPEGGTIALANTAPDVNLDEVLSALDGDTRAYLRLLIVGAGQGLQGQDKNLGKLLGSVGPLNHDVARVSKLVAERRQNLADLVHNLSDLTKEVGKHSGDINQLVTESNSALSAIAVQDPDVQRAVADLPGAVAKLRGALNETPAFANALGSTFNDLRPFARNLPGLNSSLTDLANTATPVIKNRLRPLVRAARPVIPPLRGAANKLSGATPKLTSVTHEINRLGNMAAYNPNGANPPGSPGRDEGYLYWAAWLGHNGNLVFDSQDANGLFRRIYLTASCADIHNLLASNPLAGAISGLDRLTGVGDPCHL
jgi:phospholipid/cholesterol/gamma-HCH transport system substrate-binding protein